MLWHKWYNENLNVVQNCSCSRSEGYEAGLPVDWAKDCLDKDGLPYNILEGFATGRYNLPDCEGIYIFKRSMCEKCRNLNWAMFIFIIREEFIKYDSDKS